MHQHAVLLTVANSGPVKKPTKLMAMDAAMMLGTLRELAMSYNKNRSNLQPEDELQAKGKHTV